jgi:hypothetical protein
MPPMAVRHDIAFAELAAGRVLDEANRFNA